MTGKVRPFSAEDAPEVANLFQRIFRHDRAPAPLGLASYLNDVFLAHPWFDSDLPSLIYVGPDGSIGGFLGVIPVRMSYGGQPLRAAVASSIMVSEQLGDPLAGARLLRTFFQGPQDLSVSETASDVTRRMWLSFGARILPTYSLEWLRILRPAALGISLVETRVPLAAILRPVARGVDRLARSRMGEPAPTPKRGIQAASVPPNELIPVVQRVAVSYPLRPEFDIPTLRWLLGHAAKKERYGSPVARIVRDGSGEAVGGYLAHSRPHGLVRVMQAFARPGAAAPVIDDLLAQADQLGAAAVLGRNQPDLMEHLLLRRCIFRRLDYMIAHSRRPELLDLLGTGEGLINGLAGETWIRLIGGEFGRERAEGALSKAS